MDRPVGPTFRSGVLGAIWLLALATGVVPARTVLVGSQAGPTSDATVVLAGGCFWGVEAVFEHVRGVRSVTSGYAKHANPLSPVPIESVRIVYSPSQVTYRQLLEVFFLVAHDPTTKDRQGPDRGPEYRAVVFSQSPAEQDAALSYIAELTRARRFSRPIVTEVRALSGFSVAEAFHQNYAFLHPTAPYIVQNDAPKLMALQQRFPQVYQKDRAP